MSTQINPIRHVSEICFEAGLALKKGHAAKIVGRLEGERNREKILRIARDFLQEHAEDTLDSLRMNAIANLTRELLAHKPCLHNALLRPAPWMDSLLPQDLRFGLGEALPGARERFIQEAEEALNNVLRALARVRLNIVDQEGMKAALNSGNPKLELLLQDLRTQEIGAHRDMLNALEAAFMKVESIPQQMNRKDKLRERTQAKRDLRMQRQKWLKQAAAAEYLDISAKELVRWSLDGRVPIAETETHRRGRKVIFYDINMLDIVRERIHEWRVADLEFFEKSDPVPARQTRFGDLLSKHLHNGMMDFSRNAWLSLIHLPGGHNETLFSLSVPLDSPKTHEDWNDAFDAAKTKITQWTESAEALALPFVSAFQTRVEQVARAYGKQDFLFRGLLTKALRINASNVLEMDDIAYKLPALLDGAIAQAITLFRREHRSHEVKNQAGLNNYPNLFPVARSIKRKLVLYVGPTNSGKTFEALNMLAQAKTGSYLAPLRLMAMEGAENMAGRGVLCSMHTGEERIDVEGACHVSSTIEMFNTENPVDVVVVDEIQMILDQDRGWAWTQAVVGAPAKIVAMTGSPDAVPTVVALAEMLGEELEVRVFERKAPLRALKAPVSITQVQKGDAIVAFSRSEVLRFKEILNQAGHKVSCIYGALGPEVRRSEARRFREGESDIVVATDAIGMGLNLPIGRVLFSSLEKFDGIETRDLKGNEIRQIGGRAGRYGLTEAGYVGILLGSGSTSAITQALSHPAQPPDDSRPYVQAPWRAVEIVSKLLETENLVDVLDYIHHRLLSMDENFRAPDMQDQRRIASAINNSGLDLRTRHGYLGCPVDGRSPDMINEIAKWAHIHGMLGEVKAPKDEEKLIGSTPGTHADLEVCERYAKRLTYYLWLSMRWPEIYTEESTARAMRDEINTAIERGLRAKALARTCRNCGILLLKNHRFAQCNSCYRRNDWRKIKSK